MKYVYFISFSHPNGFGNIQTAERKEIKDIEHIRDIAKDILSKDRSLLQVTILYFVLLRIEK